MTDNIKADHIADVHDMVVDNTQSGSDNDVTIKDTSTEVEADKIKDTQAEQSAKIAHTTQAELDEILEDFYDGDIRQSDMGNAKQAILQWVADEIIGEEEIVRLEADHNSFAAKKKSNRNWLRYEQREKLKAEGWKDE